MDRHLIDPAFVDIKVGSSAAPAGQQGSYSIGPTASGAHNNRSTKDSLRGAEPPTSSSSLPSSFLPSLTFLTIFPDSVNGGMDGQHRGRHAFITRQRAATDRDHASLAPFHNPPYKPQQKVAYSDVVTLFGPPILIAEELISPVIE